MMPWEYLDPNTMVPSGMDIEFGCATNKHDSAYEPYWA